MSISIVINTETAAEARMQMALLLGNPAAEAYNEWKKPDAVPAAELKLDEKAFLGETTVQNDAGQQTTTRERGKPSPGHARRTKAEIAEDDEAEKLAASQRVAAVKADVLADAAASEAAPEDDAATVKQDEADEAAETAAAAEERPADKKLTLDDVRNALGAYVKVYGMDACQQDGPKIITLVCGEGKVKMSDIPDDQAVLQKVVDGVAEMLAKNPFKRAKVA